MHVYWLWWVCQNHLHPLGYSSTTVYGCWPLPRRIGHSHPLRKLQGVFWPHWCGACVLRRVAGWVAGWVAGMMTWNKCDDMDHSRRFPAYLAPGTLFSDKYQSHWLSQSSGQVRLPRGMSTPSDTDREFSANRSWDWIFSSSDSHGGSQNKGCGILINTII